MTERPGPLGLVLCALLVHSLVGSWVAPTWGQESGPKRLIYYSSGTRDTQYVRKNWREMEQMPFDGIGITVAVDRSKPTIGKGATANLLGWRVMGPRLFRMEEFRDAVEDLRVPRWRTFSDNFFPVALSAADSAGGLNWFDDGRWHIVVNNFGVLAGIAAKGGAKGLLFDPEHYNYALFSYPSQRQQRDRPFEDYARAARQRGRQVMAAIAAHLPDAVLFWLYGYTLPFSELRGRTSLQNAGYGLLPAFCDGLLEAMPPKARFIDGYEFAYGFKDRRQFLDGYRRIRQEALRLSAVPEVYREKVKAGFGLMLDYRGQQHYFSPAEFKQAVGYALEISDGYVWIYSEGPQFFPPSGIESSYIDAIVEGRRGMKQ